MARRLLATYLTITALTLAVVLVPLGRTFADRERDRLAFDIERDTHAVASLVEDDLEAGLPVDLDPVLADYRSTGGRIVVVDRQGIAVADSDHPDTPARDFSTRPEIAAALDGQRASGTRRSETVGSDLLFVAVPVASGGSVHGAVRITYPTSALDDRVDTMWVRLGLLATVVLAIVAVVGMALAQGVAQPVRTLRTAAGHLASGHLGARVDDRHGPPELRDLARTFNGTAEQLEQLVATHQRFVADASHQLRTPLTALRLRLETLEPLLPDEGRPKLAAALAETERLSRLVQSLLVLARSDVAAGQPEPIALAPVIAARVEAWSPVAAEEGVRIASTCAPDLHVLAVPGAIEQVLDNLLSNALAVAPPSTEVEVRAVGEEAGVAVHVIDRGPGLSAQDREQAFERFWRPPGATRTPSSGFGLGLAIVARLAAASGGHARLDPGADGHGLDAVVVLPAEVGRRLEGDRRARRPTDDP